MLRFEICTAACLPFWSGLAAAEIKKAAHPERRHRLRDAAASFGVAAVQYCRQFTPVGVTYQA